MARSRYLGMAVLLVALVAAHRQSSRADEPAPGPANARSARTLNATCVVYPLSELGDDPSLGKWVAETIPQMIQPGTWSKESACQIRYYAPAKVLVIHHTPAVHIGVAAFLNDLKKAVPARKDRSVAGVVPAPSGVVRADHTEPAPAKFAVPAASAKSTYPVPAPLEQPKHLFHLIFRYEGDGLVDSVVKGLAKELANNNMVKADADGKNDPESAKATPVNQLLQFIVRYEGDGIIDSNVAALLKDLAVLSGIGDAKPNYSIPNGPGAASTGTSPVMPLYAAPGGQAQLLAPAVQPMGIPVAAPNSFPGAAPYAPSNAVAPLPATSSPPARPKQPVEPPI